MSGRLVHFAQQGMNSLAGVPLSKARVCQLTTLQYARQRQLVEQFAKGFAGQEEVDFVGTEDRFAGEGFTRQGDGGDLAVGVEDAVGVVGQ